MWSSKAIIEDEDGNELYVIMSYTSVTSKGIVFNWVNDSGIYKLHLICASTYMHEAIDIAHGLMIYFSDETVSSYEPGILIKRIKECVNSEKLLNHTYNDIISDIVDAAQTQITLYPNNIDDETWGDAPFEQKVFASITVYLNGFNYASQARVDTFANRTKIVKSSIDSIEKDITGKCGLMAILNKPISYTERDFALLIYSPIKTTKIVSFYLAELSTWSPAYNYLYHTEKIDIGWNYIPLDGINVVNTNNFTRVLIVYEKEDSSLITFSDTKIVLIQGMQPIVNKIKTEIETVNNDYSLIAYGDSLTQGAGSSGVGYRYLDICKTELGAKNDYPFGYGGSASKAIAFTAGALSGYVPPNTHEFSLKYADLTENISIALNQLNNKTVIIDGKEYTISQTGNTTYSLPSDYVPSNKWLPVTLYNAYKTADIYIIWVGTNDGTYVWDIIDAMVAKLPHKQYIIMGMTRLGTNTTIENEQIAYRKYGSHFFNTRVQMINNAFAVLDIEPTTDDTTAMNNGLMPPSLLHDSTHFNDAGYRAIGKLLAIHIQSCGYTYQKRII